MNSVSVKLEIHPFHGKQNNNVPFHGKQNNNVSVYIN